VFFIASFYTPIFSFESLGQSLLTVSLPFSAIWASKEAEFSAAANTRQNLAFGSTASGGSSVFPWNRKRFWKKDSGSTADSDMENKNYSMDNDHVMVSTTLHVASMEKPRSADSARI
jgi:hypothetical protein